MTKTLNIAVFGLNTTDINQLKTQIVLCLPSNTQPNWVNIAEEKIDVLFVTDIFFNSIGIQNTLKERAQRYLKLTKSNRDFGKIIGDQLFYPFSDVTYLSKWFSQELLPNTDETIQLKPSNKHFHLNTKNEFPTVLKSETTLEQVFSEIFTPRNGYIQLFDASGFIALVDTRTERVWIEENMTGLQFNDSLNQTYATSQIVHENTEGKLIYDLRTWLWQTLSHSSMLTLPKAQMNQNFKLDIWPQFAKNMHRRDDLKMAACFSEGANIEAVKQHLNSTDEKILNFVSYASLLQLGRFIESDEVKFSTDINQIQTSQTNKLRNFFEKVRKKLGL